MKVVIIGAGPAGLSAAFELAKREVEVAVYEAQDVVGGMCKSIPLWGQIVDLGPHRFYSKEKRISTFFYEILKEDYTVVNRLTRIYYRNTFFDYPLKISNVLKNLPIGITFKIMVDYLRQQIMPVRSPKSFEEWVTNRFGKKLYEIFFKHYSEKLWGIPCHQIDANWAAQRIKTLSLTGAIINALRDGKNNNHPSLIDEFAYPKNGTGALYEKTKSKVEELGGYIYLNSPVQKILLDENKASGIILADGTAVKADHVISTMPITSLLKGLSVPAQVQRAADNLHYRNTILVYLEIDALNLFSENWIYIHSPKVRHGRITNFRNWCPSLNKGKDTSILCLEYWAFEEDFLWKEDNQNIEALAKAEIREIGLIKASDKILNATIIRIPKCYPVYEVGYQKHLDTITDYLDQISNLSLIGRYGAFKYNNQDHSILMGILAARNVLGESAVNLWDINTDIEYQEEGKIKDILIQ